MLILNQLTEKECVEFKLSESLSVLRYFYFTFTINSLAGYRDRVENSFSLGFLFHSLVSSVAYKKTNTTLVLFLRFSMIFSLSKMFQNIEIMPPL